jgi:hypothetical protein
MVNRALNINLLGAFFIYLKFKFMPTIDIPDKICPHCGGTRWVTYQRTKTLASGDKKTYTFYSCSKKGYENGKRWRKTHIEHHRKTARQYSKIKRKTNEIWRVKDLERKKEYYQENKERIDNYKKEWIARNIEKERAYGRKSAKNGSDNLSNTYLRGLLIQLGIKKEDLNDDIITKYKTYITALRQLKQIEKNEKETSN